MTINANAYPNTGGMIVNQFLGVFANTTSTSSATGAVQIWGGIGIAGNINTGGNLTVANSTTIGTFIKLTPGTAPSSPEEGTVYYDSASHTLKFYNGTAWKTVTTD
jgi:hypothetical protein